MATFRYRAATAAGDLRTGELEAPSALTALNELRRRGLRPISAVEAKGARGASGSGASPVAVARGIGELGVMMDAGVPLDRALAVVVENLGTASARTAFARLLDQVREGSPLSSAMTDAGDAFPPMASAMTAAGEANGRPAEALAKLAEALESDAALRAALLSALIYPALLLVIAIGVISLMLFWVVPQFEGLFTEAGDRLPPMTRLVLAVSEGARHYGLYAVVALVLIGLATWRWSRGDAARLALDRLLLATPALGVVVRHAETARFARVLSSLVEGGVALPEALAIANGSLANRAMNRAISGVVERLRQGGGLTGPLAATGALPTLAISYLRTGEETARLGPMLGRLADMLDRDVRVRIERLIAIATPVVTVAMGAIVAIIIASIMTAILGFDDLALSN